jgi:hypothetical protein
MKKLLALGVIGIVAAMIITAVSATSASAAPTTVTNTTAVPITGRLADGSGSVSGTYVIRQVVEQSGTLAAVGAFTGSVTDGAGQVAQGTQDVTIPLTASSAAATPAAAPAVAAAAVPDCPILHLNLAPLHLDLLGLVVDLDQVILDIVAQPGAGNLLGNLLCAIAGLLDGPSPLAGLVGLLNNLLGALGSL